MEILLPVNIVEVGILGNLDFYIEQKAKNNNGCVIIVEKELCHQQ